MPDNIAEGDKTHAHAHTPAAVIVTISTLVPASAVSVADSSAKTFSEDDDSTLSDAINDTV